MAVYRALLAASTDSTATSSSSSGSGGGGGGSGSGSSCGVVLIGESAGGNLAVGLVQGAAAAGLPLPITVVLLSPWVDLTHSGDSHLVLAGLDPTLSVRYFLGPASRAYAGETPQGGKTPGVSPLFSALPSGFPPTLISTATRDLLLSDSVRLASALRTCGATVELHVAEGLWHVYEWYPELPEAAASIVAVANFVSNQLAECGRATAQTNGKKSAAEPSHSLALPTPPTSAIGYHRLAVGLAGIAAALGLVSSLRKWWTGS
jgi:hypothetical protein